MGIDHNGLRFLLLAWRSGASFRKTIMLGRQGLHVSDVRLAATLKEFGMEVTTERARELISQGEGYAEPLLRLLGCEEVHSIDASSFEGATYVKDFNLPSDQALEGKYTAVIDGGSLEHIFNFPVAIENCMRLVAEGGHFITIAPANNQMGHGLYQFSPDLYFRLLCRDNGFNVELCIAAEDSPRPRWYQVADPATVGRRVGARSNIPTYLFVRANRIGPTPPRLVIPQQSDYSVHWAKNSPGNRPRFSTERTERVKLAISPIIDFAKRAEAAWHSLRPFQRRPGFVRFKP